MGHDPFLPLHVLQPVHARRLDDVHDVDAIARANLVRAGHQLSAHVARNDGSHDDALRASGISKNKTFVAVPLLDGVRIFCRLARSRRWNLCARGGVHGSGDAIRMVESHRSLACKPLVDRRWLDTIDALENETLIALPFAIWMCLLASSAGKRFPTRLQTRSDLLPLLRRPNADFDCPWNDESPRDHWCHARHRRRKTFPTTHHRIASGWHFSDYRGHRLPVRNLPALKLACLPLPAGEGWGEGESLETRSSCDRGPILPI